jgi:hypothetical protein
MTDQSIEDASRKEFEAHFHFIDPKKTKDSWGKVTYAYSHVEAMWEGWQAARQSSQSEPVAVFTGKFKGNVNGKQWIECELTGAMPNTGDLLYAAPQQASHSEPASETIKKVIRYAFAQIQDFSDADCRDHGFRRSSIDKAQEWLNKQYDLAAPQQAIPSGLSDDTIHELIQKYHPKCLKGVKRIEVTDWWRFAKAIEKALSASPTAPIERDK